MTEFVRYEYDDRVATITLANGDVGNPFHPEAGAQMLAAVLRAKREQARVIVLRAEGRFFSVGGDISGFAAQDEAAVEGYILELAEGAHRIVTELMRADAIVVSAVQGMAAGVGFPLAAAADVVLAADTAKFSLAYSKVGLSPDGGGSLLVHTLGLHTVLRLALLGDTVSAQDLADAGLVARVVPAEQLAATTDEVVAVLRGGSAPSLVATKKLIRGAVTSGSEDSLRLEAETISRLAAGGDGREGVAAFMAKRPPAFG